MKPRIVSNQAVRHLDDHQCMLINRMRHGHMIVAGQSLYVLECAPAANAALAANEAEKASNIKVLEITSFGSFGRVYLAHDDRLQRAVAVVGVAVPVSLLAALAALFIVGFL